MIEATLAHAMTKAAIETYETLAEQKADQFLEDEFRSVEDTIRAGINQMHYYVTFELVIPANLTVFENKIQERFVHHLEKLGYKVCLFHSEHKEETTLLYDIRWVR